jgi:hypothetical protein
MTNQTDAKLMCLIAALRHGITTLYTPGLSVNTHPNPFFLMVNGEVDLKHIAERVLINLSLFDAQEKKRQEADAATAASAVDGH